MVRTGAMTLGIHFPATIFENWLGEFPPGTFWGWAPTRIHLGHLREHWSNGMNHGFKAYPDDEAILWGSGQTVHGAGRLETSLMPISQYLSLCYFARRSRYATSVPLSDDGVQSGSRYRTLSQLSYRSEQTPRQISRPLPLRTNSPRISPLCRSG
jgi:hypothetical protein